MPSNFSEILAREAKRREKEIKAKAAGGCIGWILGLLVAAFILMAVWNGVIVDPDNIGLHAGKIGYGNALALWFFISVVGRAFTGAKRA